MRQHAAAAARTLAITGGGDGAGKTQIAANLAAALAAMRQRVLLIDADPDCGSARLLLDGCMPGDLADVASGRRAFADAAVVGSAGVCVAAASSQEGSPGSLPPWQRERLARSLSAAGYDFILIDGPPDALDLASGAVEPIIVCTPGAESVANAYAAFKRMARQRPGLRAKLLVNRADAEATENAYRAVAAISRRFLGISPEYAGGVPEDAAVRQACDGRKLFVAESPDSQAGAAVRGMAARLCRFTCATLRRGRSSESSSELPALQRPVS